LPLWPHSYKDAANDGDAFDRLMAYFRSSGLTVAEAMMLLPNEQITLLGVSRWADQGFPQIIVGHKYAAALMATHVSEDMAAEVQPPWPAFLIELPNGLLPIKGEDGKELFLQRVLVHRTTFTTETGIGGSWQFVAFSEGAYTIWRHGLPTEELSLGRLKGAGIWEGAAFVGVVDGIDQATTDLLGKLIANVCLAMSNPDNVKTRPENGSVGSVPKTRAIPKLRSYKLGKPISVDVRQALNDFIHGRRSGSSPTVQTIVRGHWKPKLAARIGRSVWVEPYPRGPEDGPVLVRPVHLKG